MRSPSTNQRRRSSPNRQPSTSANQRPAIVFAPKLKYSNSVYNDKGVLVVSKRKRALPTAEEVEVKKARLLQIKVKQVSLVNLRHKIIALWEYGMHTDNLQFGPKSSKKIIEFLQQKYPHYARFNAAKSLFWRTIKKHREGLEPLKRHRTSFLSSNLSLFVLLLVEYVRCCIH